ncbi:unnamed protein product [Rhizophagus irregularis]|nr:unnamed protein product [Rhizophagus irregularis]
MEIFTVFCGLQSKYDTLKSLRFYFWTMMKRIDVFLCWHYEIWRTKRLLTLLNILISKYLYSRAHGFYLEGRGFELEEHLC